MKKNKRNTIPTNDILLYIAALFVMFAVNCIGNSYEPASLGVYFAMLTNGFSSVLSFVSYVLSGLIALKAGVWNFLTYAISGALLLFVSILYKRAKKNIGAEGILYLIPALLPYIFLSSHVDYAFLPENVYIQKSIIAAAILLFSGISSVALKCMLYKIFRCRLKGEETIFLSAFAVAFGIGIYRLGGANLFNAFAFIVILSSALILKSSEGLIFGIIVSLPQAICEQNATYIAVFTIYSAIAVFFSREGKWLTAIACILAYVVSAYPLGIYSLPTGKIILYVACGAIPCIISAIIPSSLYSKAENCINAYRNRHLTRIAINRNRSIIGEQLFELSSLFRQIKGTFFSIGEDATFGDAVNKVILLVQREMCSSCDKKQDCAKAKVPYAIEKLVNVGCAKGKVSLIDLPKEIATHCSDANALLNAINRQLKDYGRFIEESEIAESGRMLLAEQAHGISEVLKNIALEQSRPLTSYTERERDIAEALAKSGISSSEILIYGEGENLTLSMTVFGKYDVKRIIAALKKCTGIDFLLSEKISVSHDKFSYIFRRRTKYDAVFGIASKTKDGETVSGDTHTVIKIDERKFIVALADGCGSGEKARDVSDATISLLESFYRAKMPADTILSTVNKLLTFADEDSFTCLDIACVNLDDGGIDVVKLGAPLGFIFTESEIKMLEAESLPIGAVETIRPTTMRTTLKENDMLVFLSDGITAAFGSSADLFDYIKNFSPLNPGKLADDILSKALSLYGGVAKDDMTVVAVRLIRREEN